MMKIVRKLLVTALVLGVAGGSIALYRQRTRSNPNAHAAVFHVERGPLTISVTESGTLQARDLEVIQNEVEGRRSIIFLVPEGARVQKGDLLVELDASSLVDGRLDQEIRVQNAEADFVNAEENLAVVKNQAKSDVNQAELALRFAHEDLRNYLDGEYPNQLKQAEAQITLAEEELTRARETLEWSRRLAEERFISQTEKQADELREKKRALDLELARNNLDLLTDFTYGRKLAQLESDVQEAEMALERVTRKARADTVQAEARLKAREAEFRRQRDRLAKIEEQIEKARIHAPIDGQVIYATSTRRRRWNQEPLSEGMEVRERQELIHLPATASAKAEISIHESNLEKIRTGMPAEITVDALPDRVYTGAVARIAPLPDAQSMWMNPDLKIYNTDIHIDNSDESLRPGMSCQARIIAAEYEQALYIPIQSVIRAGRQPTVFVLHNGVVESRNVQIGLDNNRMVHILGGLEEGEAVLLAPPLDAGVVDVFVDDTPEDLLDDEDPHPLEMPVPAEDIAPPERREEPAAAGRGAPGSGAGRGGGRR